METNSDLFAVLSATLRAYYECFISEVGESAEMTRLVSELGKFNAAAEAHFGNDTSLLELFFNAFGYRVEQKIAQNLVGQPVSDFTFNVPLVEHERPEVEL